MAIKKSVAINATMDITCLQDMVGKTYFFRTVTYHMVGLVTGVMGNFVLLSQATWVAESGRFMQCITEGAVNEVEPVGCAGLNMDTVTDFFPWVHDPFTTQK